MTSTPPVDSPLQKEKVGIGAYISLICACIFFSGTLTSPELYGVFDFSVLKGAFGKVLIGAGLDGSELTTVSGVFRGKGGSGAFDGFMFSLTLFPAVMFAISMVTVFEHYGALKAAGRLLTPIMRPVLGLPGTAVLAMITSMQAMDAAAAMTRQLEEGGDMTHKEVLRLCAYHMVSPGCITNFFSSGAVLFTLTAADGAHIPLTMGTAFLVLLAFRFISCFIMRGLTMTIFKNV